MSRLPAMATRLIVQTFEGLTFPLSVMIDCDRLSSDLFRFPAV
jgi:hypothetical protein